MARNEEKQMGRLNRLILEREKQEFQKKHPKRPKLFTLNSADEIKQWLPSIKADIDFCLKQSMVICYSESKIQEYRDEVTKLEKEYKSFVHKLRSVDPEMGAVPWTNRPYKRKQQQQQPECSTETTTTVVDPSSEDVDIPILKKPHCAPKVNPPVAALQPNLLEDQPLQFSGNFQEDIITSRKEYEEKLKKETRIREYNLPSLGFEDKLRAIYGMSSDERPKPAKISSVNILGIDYSSGEEEEYSKT